MNARAALACCVLALSLLPRVARADVQRLALIAGNNLGNDSDGPLHYAEADAEKMQSVLRDLGGFPPGNITVLKGEDRARASRS